MSAFQYFCPTCGTPNNYINGNKPKFCGECGLNLHQASPSIASALKSSPPKSIKPKKTRVIDEDDDYEDYDVYPNISFGSR